MKPQAAFANFDALDIRTGTIVKVEDAATKKPTYRMTIDFGPEIGTRVSCGAYRNYPKEQLLNQQIIAIINLGDKKMGPETSQALVLGVPNAEGETIYLTPQSKIADGANIF